MPADQYPVPVRRSRPPAQRPNRALATVATRALPAATASMGALVASLAVERTLARAVTLALGRAGRAAAATPFAIVVPGGARTRTVTIVTETTMIERVTRRR